MIIEMIPQNIESLVATTPYKIGSAEEVNIFFRNPSSAPVSSPVLNQRIWFNGDDLPFYYTNNWRKTLAFLRENRLFKFNEGFSEYSLLQENELLALAHATDIFSLGLSTSHPSLPDNVALFVLGLEDTVLMTDYKRIHNEFLVLSVYYFPSIEKFVSFY